MFYDEVQLHQDTSLAAQRVAVAAVGPPAPTPRYASARLAARRLQRRVELKPPAAASVVIDIGSA
jgi:hypothetical protein